MTDYTFSICRNYFTSNDGSQNTFVYQSTLDASELRTGADNDCVISWKWKGIFNSKLKPLFTVFFSRMKLSGHRMRIKFDKDPLAVEQNNYLAKIINVYIVYDLDTWPKDPTNNFNLRTSDLEQLI